MTDFKLLIVEDDESQVKTFKYLIDEFQEEQGITIECIVGSGYDGAVELIESEEFDGAVIDLKLDNGTPDEFKGLKLIEQITEKARCPVIVYSANYQNVPDDAKVVISMDRTENFNIVLDKFLAIQLSGLTEIMKRTGIIEEFLNKIYWNNIIPDIDTWLNYVNEKRKTKKSLLRFTINHLQQLLEDGEESMPEEMYISPPMNEALRTGSIIKMRENGGLFVVLSPECDLVKYGENKKMKTDHILLCKIDTDLESLYSKAIKKSNKTKASSKKNVIENYIKNNAEINYHWLPSTSFFGGGVILFRDVHSCTPEKYEKLYETPKLQISPPFTKNILGRFSTYYSRQGQPDFEFSKLAKTEYEKIPVPK